MVEIYVIYQSILQEEFVTTANSHSDTLLYVPIASIPVTYAVYLLSKHTTVGPEKLLACVDNCCLVLEIMVEAYILLCCLLLAFVVFCWLGMNKEAEFAIRRMATDLAPTTKSGFVRAMLPAIEEALNAGHTIKAIWERLSSSNPIPQLQGVLRLHQPHSKAGRTHADRTGRREKVRAGSRQAGKGEL